MWILGRYFRRTQMFRSISLPTGITERSTLTLPPLGSTKIRWSEDGTHIAASSDTGYVFLWKPDESEEIRSFHAHEGPLVDLVWVTGSRSLLTVGADRVIKTWDTATLGETSSHTLIEEPVAAGYFSATETIAVCLRHRGVQLFSAAQNITTSSGLDLGPTTTGYPLKALSWSPVDEVFVTLDTAGNTRLWNASVGPIVNLNDNRQTTSFAWSPDGRKLTFARTGHVISITDVPTGRIENELQGHSARIHNIIYSSDGRLLASASEDGEIRLWRTDTWELLFTLTDVNRDCSALAFHPTRSTLTSYGGDPGKVRVWDIDTTKLLTARITPTSHYRNAKVILVGDTGVGKSGLALVLTGQKFAATDSTDSRQIHTFDISEYRDGFRREVRETLLWDLAGQPGYRLIHQIHLGEASVALLVFDSRNETDPIAGVRHWQQALQHLASRRGKTQPCTTFLVAARADRGGVAMTPDQITRIVATYGFKSFFDTSAKDNANISALATAVRNSIRWEELPTVTSSALFERMKAFLLEQRKLGHLLSTGEELYKRFLQLLPTDNAEDLPAQFATSITLLEHRDLVKQLSFGGYILLRPELLDGYCSALINAAKKNPDGFGSITKERALKGKYIIPKDVRTAVRAQEELLFIATVEELLTHELAFPEEIHNETHLVFPSQCLREWDVPESFSESIRCFFRGNPTSIYSTLAVRLTQTESFQTERLEMWRNTAVYSVKTGGKCALHLLETEEDASALVLYCSLEVSIDDRLRFEQYVVAHLDQRAVEKSVLIRRACRCDGCGTTVPEPYVMIYRSKGKDTFPCPCGKDVWVADPNDRSAEARRIVAEMNKIADYKRVQAAAAVIVEGKRKIGDFDVFLCHNARDKDLVKSIGKQLMAEGILPWLDEWEIRPGVRWQEKLEDQLSNIKAAAVFLSGSEIRRWQRLESEGIIAQFIDRGLPVIPVILPVAVENIEIPNFLAGFQAVDFRKSQPNPVEQLAWGILGDRLVK